MKPVFPIVICAAAFAAGCCSVINGTTQKLPVESVPSGARVYQNGEFVGTTPMMLRLKRKRDYAIRLEMDGYEVTQTLLESGMSNWALLDFIFLPSLFIDLPDGAFYSFPMSRMRETLVLAPRALPAKAAAEAPRSPDNSDMFQRLKNLKSLHDQFLISDDEYIRKLRQLFESF